MLTGVLPYADHLNLKTHFSFEKETVTGMLKGHHKITKLMEQLMNNLEVVEMELFKNSRN